MWNKILVAAAFSAVVMATPASAALVLIFGEDTVSSNSTHTGASGTVSLTFSDVASGEVMIDATVSNTTGDTIFGAGATVSVLTAFGMDLFGGATLKAGSFIGGSYLDTLIENAVAQPFGPFDIAAADNSNYNGGNANGALPQGLSDSFSLVLLSSLDAVGLQEAFEIGLFGNNTSGLRFQQVNAGAGSDKLINPFVFDDSSIQGEVPLPAAGWMLLAGLGGLAAAKRRRKAA